MVEIMGYILGVCLKVKDYRICWYNVIVNCVVEKCKGEGWMVCFEFKIVDVQNKMWKLDFVLVKDKKVVVLDFIVKWEVGLLL